jgi:hypothetical protein
MLVPDGASVCLQRSSVRNLELSNGESDHRLYALGYPRGIQYRLVRIYLLRSHDMYLQGEDL